MYLRLMPSLETSLFIEMTGVLQGKAVRVGMGLKKKKKGTATSGEDIKTDREQVHRRK